MGRNPVEDASRFSRDRGEVDRDPKEELTNAPLNLLFHSLRAKIYTDPTDEDTDMALHNLLYLTHYGNFLLMHLWLN